MHFAAKFHHEMTNQKIENRKYRDFLEKERTKNPNFNNSF
jgi:hypothetical protein